MRRLSILPYNEPAVNLSQESVISAATRPLRVVAIGGGTGLSTLLRGLCHQIARRQEFRDFLVSDSTDTPKATASGP